MTDNATQTTPDSHITTDGIVISDSRQQSHIDDLGNPSRLTRRDGPDSRDDGSCFGFGSSDGGGGRGATNF